MAVTDFLVNYTIPEGAICKIVVLQRLQSFVGLPTENNAENKETVLSEADAKEEFRS